MNINILGISEIKWTGMGEFTSDDHYICYHGQKSLRRNRVAIIVNKRVQNAVLGCNLKNDISARPGDWRGSALRSGPGLGAAPALSYRRGS